MPSKQVSLLTTGILVGAAVLTLPLISAHADGLDPFCTGSSPSPSISVTPQNSVSPTLESLAQTGISAAPLSPTPSATQWPTVPPPPTESASPSPSESASASPSVSASGEPCPPLPDCPFPPSANASFGYGEIQDDMEEAAREILAAMADGDDDGYSGIIADLDRAQLLLCWQRDTELPDSLVRIRDRLRPRIRVVQMGTTYTKEFLEGRVGLILGNVALGVRINGTIHTVVVPEEGTGLYAEVKKLNLAIPDAQFIAAAQQVLTQAAGVPVFVSISDPPELLTRKNDASPWSAGGRLNAPRPPNLVQVCSSAFGITRGGRDHLLTAEHCYGAENVFSGAGNPIGRVTLVVHAYDSEIIEIANGRASNTVYLGGVNDHTEISRVVNGSGLNVVGFLVHPSGSVSGEHQLVQVKRVNVRYVGMGPFVRAGGTIQRVTVAKGDSGGPVVRFRQIDQSWIALGVISAGRYPINCNVGNNYDATDCFTEIIYADIDLVLAAYGAALK